MNGKRSVPHDPTSDRRGRPATYARLLEQLRNESKGLWGASSEAYFRVDRLLRQLADPSLHDIPSNLPFRVEMWDREHIRWVIAASASVAVGHAALDAAVANYPGQRFTLRNGALVIRQR